MESFEVCRCVPHCHPSDRSLLRDAQVSLLVVCDGGPQSITEIDDREILQPALRVLEPQATGTDRLEEARESGGIHGVALPIGRSISG